MSMFDDESARGFLYTDQYQLTMAQLYFRAGLHERAVQFDLLFRDYPDYGEHKAGYCICAGLEPLLQWIEQTRITESDLECLRNHKDTAGNRIFDDAFLAWLGANGTFEHLDLDAVPEGRVIHPHTPVLTVRGPLAIAQILETALLNHVTYPILVATKASRIRKAGEHRPLLEFGLRRAQSWAANAGTRAALVGGADFSSNTGASHALGIPPKGTHAHSMVQVFLGLGEEEIDAFRAFADTYPDNCILLVDTLDTLGSGVPNAIRVFEELRGRGHQPRGIRLDSGDLAYLAVESARMLNDAGFEDVAIVLSGDLDELALWQILQQIRDDAPRAGLNPEEVIGRLIYGVGTNLITSMGAPALQAAYKLVAVRHQDQWRPTVKISETPAKTPTPGEKVLWRIYDNRGKANADVLAAPDEDLSAVDSLDLHHPVDPHRRRTLTGDQISRTEKLLRPFRCHGKRLEEAPTLEEMRHRRDADLDTLDAGVRRLVNPHTYHVSLTTTMWQTKTRLVSQMSK
ncbi:MAG: nicotinate phosphoribosyltransferase [Verrucomicrobiota bacterium]